MHAHILPTSAGRLTAGAPRAARQAVCSRCKAAANSNSQVGTTCTEECLAWKFWQTTALSEAELVEAKVVCLGIGGEIQ